MASLIRAASLVIAVSAASVLTGCANDGGGMFGATTTASIPDKPRIDPACVTLTSQIDTMLREGVADKVEKAAAKKYKMTNVDLAKAAQLNKANAEFQSKCSASAMTTAMVAPAAETEGRTRQSAVTATVPSGGQ